MRGNRTNSSTFAREKKDASTELSRFRFSNRLLSIYSVEKLLFRNYSKNFRPAEALLILGRVGGMRATVARNQELSNKRSDDSSSELSIAMHPRKNLG